LIPRDPVARAAAEARATEAVRVVGRMAMEMTQEWLAAEREYLRAQREALNEYARHVHVEARTVAHDGALDVIDAVLEDEP
jgi:hypothetical protein